MFRVSLHFIVTALTCGEHYPTITNGNVSTLEPVEIDINGAQANYSCNDGCHLFGSRSLRCQILATGPLNSQVSSQWVNESGKFYAPSCLCPPGKCIVGIVESKR